jgi:hypothetical protein
MTLLKALWPVWHDFEKWRPSYLRFALVVVRPTSGCRPLSVHECGGGGSSRGLATWSASLSRTLQWGARVLRASTARAAPAADEHVAAVGDVRAVGCHSGQGAPLSQQVSLLQDHCPLHVSASRPSPPGAAQHHDPVSTFFFIQIIMHLGGV